MVPRVGIVTPIYREKCTPEEEISLHHLQHFLGSYDRYLIAPKELRFRRPDFETILFDDSFFLNAAAYSHLLLSRRFYESFRNYTYILIYQLDCLVFSDELHQWCERDFDYIGAPWLKSLKDPAKGFSRVGNGGFSLRKVESFLRVLDSPRYSAEPISYLKDVLSTPINDLQNYSLPHRFLKKLRVFLEIRKGVKWYMSHYTLNEDLFWSDRAKLFYRGFRIAPVEAALKFSFENAPRYCFEKNNCQLPFGCHGWTRWDREFWKPYLLQ